MNALHLIVGLLIAVGQGAVLTGAEDGALPAMDAAAIRHAREAGLREQIPAIRQLLNHSDEAIGIAAMVALSQWGDDPSRPAFERAAKSDVARVRIAGQEALKRLDSLERFLPYKDQSPETLAAMLTNERANVRHEAAAALLRFGTLSKVYIEKLTTALTKLDGSTTLDQIVPYLDLLRGIGPDASACGGVLTGFMEERSPINTGRDKHVVYKLRGYLAMTLGDVREAHVAMLPLMDMLANSNQPVDRNFAAAAYAIGTMGSKARELVPLLMRALNDDFKDAIPPPEAHGAKPASFVLCSGRIEAIRALAKIGPDASQALPLLKELLNSDPKPGDNVPPWKDEAAKAITAISGAAK